ncbi:MAG: flagellar biosynthesis protein FlgD [Clostridium sp.]|uniref:flagellar hook assembly protein FlgD n=1 Tax=Clostridium sp. DSM 8431 TaxID=1761781 RepID=UPI0008F2D274|nr:flagellar hook capping FlgD N-terminal domain-containing protein [Clostridium sp. DSM 8431]MCR4944388.1 flagellar biosynthesis protein FlgD [Clostridium sp.]SFU30878.1 flagellar basal-body rod modification protein FlgD [Clostridium sp. DSM 8431]
MATTNLTIKDYSGMAATDKGTKITKSGDTLDKNSFLTILAAELANQDPTQDVDSTQYVSQLAQFSALEQMQNLNQTMTDNSNRDLVGKGITVSNTDANNNQITGICYAVNKLGSSTTITLLVNEDGTNTYKDFDIDNVVSVVKVDDYSIPPLTSINGTTSFLLASSFMNKEVELSEVDTNKNPIKGTVVGVVKENGEVKVNVKTKDGEVKSYSYNTVVKVGEMVK